MKKFAMGLVLLGLSSSLGCSYAMEELGLFKDADIEVPTFGAPTEISDEKQALPIDFSLVISTTFKNCMECHATLLGTEDGTLRKLQQIRARIANPLQPGVKPMPPTWTGYPSVTPCEGEILDAWVENYTSKSGITVKDLTACQTGTPTDETQDSPQVENEPVTKPTPAPPVPLRDLEPTFELITDRIFAPKCLGCHTPTGKRGYLSSVEALENAQMISEDAASSVLYKIVVPGLYRTFMPPTRSGIPALNEEEVDFIKRWLDSRTNVSVQ